MDDTLNRRYFDLLSFDELLQKEEEWENNEGLDDRQVWLQEGVELYSAFLKMKPKEARFKVALAQLYLEWGRDEKLRYGNYKQALRMFQEVSRLNPEHPRSYYHLSFLFKYEGDWEKGIFYGEKSINKGISGTRKIKLYCNLATCYARLRYHEDASVYIRKAREEDARLDFENTTLIEFTEQELKAGHGKSYQLIRADGKIQDLNRRERDEWKDKALEENIFLIDLTDDYKTMMGPKDSVRLERREAQVIEYLILQRCSCSPEAIYEFVWEKEDQKDKEQIAQVIKRYISTIRKAIKESTGHPDPKQDILTTVGSGYQWKNTSSYLLKRS